MALSGQTLVYCRTTTGTNNAAPTAGAASLKLLKDVFSLVPDAAAANRIQIWTGRGWADLLEIKRYTKATGFSIVGLSTSSGASFIGTVATEKDDSSVDVLLSSMSSGGSIRAVAAGASADISWTPTELAATIDSTIRLLYSRATSSLATTTLTLPKQTNVYQVKIDSYDGVFWANGMLIKAYRSGDTIP